MLLAFLAGACGGSDAGTAPPPDGGHGDVQNAGCVAGTTMLTGAVEGKPLSQESVLRLWPSPDIEMTFPEAYLLTTAPSLVPGMSVPFAADHTDGWLFLGTHGAGSVYCVNGDSFLKSRVDPGHDESSVDLDLSQLGTCPGDPVDGTLLIQDFSHYPQKLTGTLDGGTFQRTQVGFSEQTFPSNPTDLSTFDDGTRILAWTDGATAWRNGFVIVPASGADGHATVYCVNETALQTDGSLQLTRLSRLGACRNGPSVGRVQVCSAL
jgi:hypothetical protein